MKTKLKTWAMVLLLLGVVSLVLLQRQENQRLMAERAALRQQSEQATSLRAENLRLAEQLKKTTQTFQADQAELIRLRSEISRLRQSEVENFQLKSQGPRLVIHGPQAQPEITLAIQPKLIPAFSLADHQPATDTTDYGEVDLSANAPVRFDIGTGRDCVITPTLLADGSVHMVIRIEGKSADGKARQLAQSRINSLPGRQITLLVGGTTIAYTPTLKTQ